MKKNRNKNYTIYWMMCISAVLTIPISVVIINRVQASNMGKTAMIMAVFIVLFLAIMILYKNIFGVTVQEITQEDKVTDLDRQFYLLSDYRKKYNNLQLRKCIEVMLELIQRFKRRSEVMLQIIGKERLSTDEGALIGLVQTVEDALVVHTTKVVKRIEIFDDLGVPEVIHRNIKEIEDQIKKCQDILMEFELLITETSRLGELKEDNDISKLRDVVNAMQSLRSDSDTEMDALKKKYENEGN